MPRVPVVIAASGDAERTWNVNEDEMEAGPELDNRVAVDVFGYDYDRANRGWFDGDVYLFANAPKYSTDIAAAWEVVEKMRADGGELHVRPAAGMGGIHHYQVTFYRSDRVFAEMPRGIATSFPLAVCRAALSSSRLTPAHPPGEDRP